MVEDRKNSMEMYGFDLMVDESFETWLIEVNSSPAMDHSTPITKKMVEEVSEDIIKVVVDNNNGRRKVLSDTGKFSCLKRGGMPAEKPKYYTNFQMEVVGKKKKKVY